jgi:hypothetical protein
MNGAPAHAGTQQQQSPDSWAHRYLGAAACMPETFIQQQTIVEQHTAFKSQKKGGT